MDHMAAGEMNAVIEKLTQMDEAALQQAQQDGDIPFVASSELGLFATISRGSKGNLESLTRP